MNHTGTVGQRNIIVAGHIMCFFMLLLTDFQSIVEKGFVFLVFQILAGISLQYFIGRNVLLFIAQLTQHTVQKCFCHIIGIVVCRLHFNIRFRRVYAKRHVGGKGPGRGGPCQNISVLTLYLKARHRGLFLYILISLRHLVRRERSSAAGAIGHDFKALV